VNKALKIDPNHVNAITSKAGLLFARGKTHYALECIEKALKINLRNEIAWNTKGAILARLGRFKEALICWNKALEINPNYQKAMINRNMLENDESQIFRLIASFLLFNQNSFLMYKRFN